MKKHLFRLIILLSGIVFLSTLNSCKKAETKSAVTISSQIPIKYQDKSGANLLNPITADHYEQSSIKLFSFNNGVKTEIKNPDLAISGNIKFINTETNHSLIVLANTKQENQGSEEIRENETLLIELSNSVTDTIKTEWVKGPNYFYNTKVWYNNELKWSGTVGNYQIVEPLVIVK